MQLPTHKQWLSNCHVEHYLVLCAQWLPESLPKQRPHRPHKILQLSVQTRLTWATPGQSHPAKVQLTLTSLSLSLSTRHNLLRPDCRLTSPSSHRLFSFPLPALHTVNSRVRPTAKQSIASSPNGPQHAMFYKRLKSHCKCTHSLHVTSPMYRCSDVSNM